MIKILQTKSGVTKFQVLIEIAAHQPNVRQKEIAAKIGITPQAVSEYIKELVNYSSSFAHLCPLLLALFYQFQI